VLADEERHAGHDLARRILLRVGVDRLAPLVADRANDGDAAAYPEEASMPRTMKTFRTVCFFVGGCIGAWACCG
jgi:hypothetical protein